MVLTSWNSWRLCRYSNDGDNSSVTVVEQLESASVAYIASYSSFVEIAQANGRGRGGGARSHCRRWRSGSTCHEIIQNPAN